MKPCSYHLPNDVAIKIWFDKDKGKTFKADVCTRCGYTLDVNEVEPTLPPEQLPRVPGADVIVEDEHGNIQTIISGDRGQTQ